MPEYARDITLSETAFVRSHLRVITLLDDNHSLKPVFNAAFRRFWRLQTMTASVPQLP